MVKKIRRHWFFILLLSTIVFAAVLALTVPPVQWRIKVLTSVIRGDIPDLSITQTLKWLKPGSPVYLEAMAIKPSPNSAIHNLFVEDQAVISQGQQQFKQTCAVCHGGDATGGVGPNLISFIAKSTDWDFLSTVKWGRKNSAMVAQPLDDKQIWSIHAYLRNKSRAWVAESAQHTTEWNIDLLFDKLNEAPLHPEDWMTYSGDFTGHRHSSLAQINKSNVDKLHVAWVRQLRPATKPLSATPIVVGGLMIVTEAPDGVVALNAKNGEVVWRFERPIDASKLPLCCGAFNRGVAVLGDKVFVGTLDAYLVALDISSGKKLWESKVAESDEGYSITSAPLALDGHILIGVAGAEYGIRGLVAAFSPDDGRLLWQFDTVPKPGQVGNETWEGDSWKTGGASTWSVGTYDKERDVVYWTIGNPWPPLDTRVRIGDNLYSNSVVALERKTGKLLWYYQFTPSDSHDWDATQQTILTDVNWKGAKVPALLMASRNAFYYVLDRRDGSFLYAKPFVKQTWASSVDEKGRPVRDMTALPSLKGSLVWPWMHGGTNWWPPSYDPKRHLHFVPTVDAATLYFALNMKYRPGEMTMGGTTQLATTVPAVMAVKAIDPDTGEIRWSTRLDHGDFKQFSRITGLVSTDGGIVVAGFEDRLSILDSDTGRELWKFNPGAQVNAGSITYSVDGVQHIAVISGNALFSFSL